MFFKNRQRKHFLFQVCFNNKKAPITLSSETLEFQNLPLNTEASRELIIINTSDQLVTLNVELEQRVPQLTITPTKALIWQKGDLVVSFTVKFEEVPVIHCNEKLLTDQFLGSGI